MANVEHLAILKKGAETWNKWRQEPGGDEAHLRVVDLSDANLVGADLSGTNLSGANLSGSSLFMADLTGADLRGADFSNVGVGGTIFGDIDMSQVRGLLSVQHHGPSTIGIDTIYNSRGEIPE